MTTPDLRAAPSQIDAPWLTTVLRASGDLADGTVTDVVSAPVGTGQMGDSVRFDLVYEGTPGPTSLVCKFPSSSEESRNSTAVTRAYEVECRFYQQIRDRVGIRTPRPYLSLYDQPTNAFVLVLEDLAPARQGDQIDGCGSDVAAVALDEVAKLHAPVWNAPDLAGLDWLNRTTPDTAAFSAMLFQGFWPGFLDRYRDRVHDDVIDVGERVISQMAAYAGDRPEQLTVVHGDYRLDNMLFGTESGGYPLATVDWQTAALGPAMTDVAYFMGTSLDPAARLADEETLVRRYWDRLVAGGVDRFPWDACWTQYRRYAFAGLLMAVGASMLVGQTERGDEMFMAMANRSGQMAIELDSLSLI